MTTESGPDRFASFVATLGRGPGRSRALTREEAREAFAMVLAGEADPHQVGAFLMLLRYRGEDPDEIAGLVEAAREHAGLGGGLPIDLDWPSVRRRPHARCAVVPAFGSGASARRSARADARDQRPFIRHERRRRIGRAGTRAVREYTRCGAIACRDELRLSARLARSRPASRSCSGSVACSDCARR